LSRRGESFIVDVPGGFTSQMMFESGRGFLYLEWTDPTDAEHGAISETTWLHVPMANQNSWAAVFTKLVPDSDLANRRAAAACGHVALRACEDGLRVLEQDGGSWRAGFAGLGMENNPRFFSNAPLVESCLYTVYELVENDRLVQEFVPAEVEVRRVGERPAR
jgi:hypothetical protein